MRIPILAIVILFSCSSQENELVGKWEMYKVYDSETDMTEIHNPESNRWIRFDPDGTFESGGDPYGKNTGKYVFDMRKGTLFIDSDMEDDDSNWNIRINGDEMTWTGIGTPRQEGFRLSHKRSE